MSRIEELIYSAHEHGKRNNLFNAVTRIRTHNPNMKLEEVYDEAYKQVMKT